MCTILEGGGALYVAPELFPRGKGAEKFTCKLMHEPFTDRRGIFRADQYF